MKKKTPNPHRENIMWTLIAIIAGIILEGYVVVASRTVPLGELVRNIFSYINWIRLAVLEIIFLGSLITVYVCNRKGKKLLENIYKYRFQIAGVALVLCVIFQISGSSIGCWETVLGYNTDKGLIAGISRGIRSDEWAVSTPMALAQEANNYKYTNNNLRGGTDTDMFIVYGQPVKDISIIFRIFHFGYILFGSGAGLSFYWCSRFIALFLASFEFLMLITNKNKRLSFVGAIVILFSPTIQWWYATNSLIEMIVSAEVGIILFDKYLKESNFKLKTIYMAIMAICVGTFILTFYPAWMVPIAYMFLPFLIWVIIENRKNIKITKGDIIAFILIAIVFAGLMARIFIKSWDTILATLNTVYPGKRVVLAWGPRNVYFNFVVNSITTILTSIDNPCDMSVMIDFWPIGLIILSIYVFKEKKADILLLMSVLVVLVLNLFYLFATPDWEWLTNILLLSKTWYGRVYQVFGLINIFMLFRMLSMLEFKFKNIYAILISVLVSGICILCTKHFYPERISLVIAVVLTAIFGFVFYTILMYNQKKNLFTFTIVIFMIATTGLVNPIRSGINLVDDNPLLNAIEEIDSKQEGLWAVVEVGLPEINLPMVVGAQTLNSTSVYPNLDLWNKIDKDKEFEDMYNRYAHIYITLVENDEETEFTLYSPDVMMIFMRYEDAKALGVKYIVRGASFEPYDITNEDFKLKELYKDNSYVIYEVL